MGMYRYFLTLLFVTTNLCINAEEIPDKRHILFLFSSGQIERGIEQYLAYHKATEQHDFTLLEQMGTTLLDLGCSSMDAEDQMLSLYAIGIAGPASWSRFLRNCIDSRNPYVQAVSIQLAARGGEDDAEEMLSRALHSQSLMVRFEALHHLVSRKSKNAMGHIQSLINLLPPMFRAYFAEFYAIHGSDEAIGHLKNLMNAKESQVRIAAVLGAVKHQRDDLLPYIRSLATHTDPDQQEICAFSFGLFGDLDSIESLKNLAKSTHTEVKLAALNSLLHLGHQEYKEEILAMAKNKDLFAISMLAAIPETESLLIDLIKSRDDAIRINAGLSLLQKRDPRAIPIMLDILSTDVEAVSFVPQISKGKSLMSWGVTAPSAYKEKEVRQQLKAITVNLQERVLEQCLDLMEQEFIIIAEGLFLQKRNHLVPLLVKLLENLNTPKAIGVLEKYAQMPGAPLVRNYCNLALYRLGTQGPYRDNVIKWISLEKGNRLIEFRPMMERTDKSTSDKLFELNPEETTGLLVESIDALAQRREIEGLNDLLRIIKDGHKKNRYLLAGLLLRAIG